MPRLSALDCQKLLLMIQQMLMTYANQPTYAELSPVCAHAFKMNQ